MSSLYLDRLLRAAMRRRDLDTLALRALMRGTHLLGLTLAARLREYRDARDPAIDRFAQNQEQILHASLLREALEVLGSRWDKLPERPHQQKLLLGTIDAFPRGSLKTAPDLAGTPRASTTRRPSTRRARSAAAPWLSREATRFHAGRKTGQTKGAPRASRVASRLAGWPEALPWRASSGSVESSRTIAALCWSAWSRAVCCLLSIPGGRSARGRRARHAACRKAAAKELSSRQAARRVPRLFAPGLRMVAR